MRFFSPLSLVSVVLTAGGVYGASLQHLHQSIPSKSSNITSGSLAKRFVRSADYSNTNEGNRSYTDTMDSDSDDSATKTYTTSTNDTSPSKARRGQGLNTKPTPAPTGKPSSKTTVHITSEEDFALLLPGRDQELISEAESDGVAFCTTANGGCSRTLQSGFIKAAKYHKDPNGKFVQITGCLDNTKFPFDRSDDGGQFDVRFPNGAQCTFGGYAASFIEQVEPSAGRFCMRCCHDQDDQVNCNSHQDRSGCVQAIKGTYDFPEKGVSCS